MQPRTQYVKGPEGYVAYQVLGSGSRDIVFDPVPLGAHPTIERWMDDITTVIDEVSDTSTPSPVLRSV